jgi:hypothetical protein
MTPDSTTGLVMALNVDFHPYFKINNSFKRLQLSKVRGTEKPLDELMLRGFFLSYVPPMQSNI